MLVSPELGLLHAHTFTLRPLPHGALRGVIEGPARLAGIKVDEHLMARLVAVHGAGQALPLLAFTLARRADGVVAAGSCPTQRYYQLGGVQGAWSARLTQRWPRRSRWAGGAASR